MMLHSPRRRVLLLLAMCLLTLGTALRTEGFEDVRAVQVLLLLSAGMCAGVALSLFLQLRRAASDGEASR